MRWVLCVIALALTFGCSGKPSKSECEKAADKMLDDFAAPRLGAGSSAPSELNQITDSWRKLLKDKGSSPTRQYLIDTCQAKMNRSIVECIDKTTNETSLAACFKS